MPRATSSAIKLPSRCADSRVYITTVSGSAAPMVNATTPPAIQGAAITRLQPSSHAALTRVMSGKEPVGDHQLLQPHHPGEGPLGAGLPGGGRERPGVVGVVHVEHQHASRVDDGR